MIRQYRISRIGFLWKSYYVYENDTLLYKAERAGALMLKGYILYTYAGDRVISVMRKSIVGISGIDISDSDNRIIGDLQHNFSFGAQKFVAHTADGSYEVKGNFKNSEFTIFLNDNDIGKVSRNRSDSKNYIGLAVHDYANQEVVLGLILSIILNINYKNKA